MEKKVIKFNLMGAIFILLLIIGIIVGLVIAIPKIKNKDANKKELEQQSQQQMERIDAKKEYTEKVKLANGKEVECRMKYYKSNFGYAMMYDADIFYVNENVKTLDDYSSLFSNKIGITVEKKKGEFGKLAEELENEGKAIKEKEKDLYDKNSANLEFNGDKYVEKNTNLNKDSNREIGKLNVESQKINNLEAVKRTLISSEDTRITYAIKKDNDNYYYIELTCSKDFEKEQLPIMIRMVESFEILI